MEESSEKGEKRTFLVLAALSIAVVALSPLFFASVSRNTLEQSVTVGSSGTIKAVGVGVYWDSSCTNRVTSISWGTAEPGTSLNSTVYIRNQGNSPATLSMNTENWNPTNASGYLTLSWNYGGQTLAVDEVVPVTFTLVVSSGVQGITSFAFDIVIVGSG